MNDELAAWLVTDIDGTITDAEGSLYLPAIQEIRRLEEAGIQVGLVSGRPYPMVRLLGEYLGTTGPLIAENGGAGFFLERDFFLGSRSTAEKALEALSGLISLEPTWDNRFRTTDYAINGGVDIQGLRKLVEEKSLELDIHVSSIMVHLATKGVTKRAGLEYCLQMVGMRSTEVAVAGDAESDTSLFEGFEKSIAPANCTDSIGRLALFRSDRPFGEGFCRGINHFRKLGIFPPVDFSRQKG